MQKALPSIPNNAFSRPEEHIRLGEFDLGGVLYHASYFHIYEEVREALLSSHSVPYHDLVAESGHLAVVESHQVFYAPVVYGNPVRTFLWTSNIKRSLVTFNYCICDSAGTPLHSAWTKHAYIQTSEGGFKPGRLPEKLLKVLKEYQA